MTDRTPARLLVVPARGTGMRLDRLLRAFFKDWSRNELVKGIKQGLVTDANGRVLRPSSVVRAGMTLHVGIPGIAPTTPPPDYPEIVFEDERLVVVNKPSGMMAHPAGSQFVWSLIGLSRTHWPESDMDLCHRLDRDTSGLLVLTKDKDANQYVKQAFKAGDVRKEYVALCKGTIPWDEQACLQPLGPGEGEIRVAQAVRQDGVAAETQVSVLERRGALTKVVCRITTGRTHQIRVHLAHTGYPLLGDRIYGVEAQVFLHSLQHGADDWVRAQTGAPRHALHCAHMVVPHPDGSSLDVSVPMPADMNRWWNHPEVLPQDRASVDL